METDQIKRRYYLIGAVAKQFNVKPSAIRFWLTVFGIQVKKIDKRGRRYFTDSEIEKIATVHRLLKIRKFTLEGARQEMDLLI